MPMRSTFEINTQIILLKIDGFVKGWILNITPLKVHKFPEGHTNLRKSPYVFDISNWFQKKI